MKILMNTHPGVVGGIARVVKNMLLDKDKIFGSTSFVIINPQNTRVKDRIIKRYTDRNVYISANFKIKRGIFKKPYSESTFAEFGAELIDFFKATINETKPDIIVVNGTYIYPWCLLQAAKTFDIPIVIYYHGTISKEFVSKDKLINDGIISYEKTFINPKYNYIFPSEFLKDYIEDTFGEPIEKSIIIPNSVPSYFFNFSHIKKKAGMIKKLGFVMRWDNVKGKKFVHKLIRHITKKNLNYEIHMITNVVEEKIISKKSDKLFLKNHLSHDKLKDFYHGIDILISPSSFETFGNVAQECIATKTPAIVSNKMGVKEVLSKIGLKEYVFDFDSYTVDKFLIKLDSLNLKIGNDHILKLHDHVLTENINTSRFKFFKKIVLSNG